MFHHPRYHIGRCHVTHHGGSSTGYKVIDWNLSRSFKPTDLKKTGLQLSCQKKNRPKKMGDNKTQIFSDSSRYNQKKIFQKLKENLLGHTSGSMFTEDQHLNHSKVGARILDTSMIWNLGAQRKLSFTFFGAENTLPGEWINFIWHIKYTYIVCVFKYIYIYLELPVVRNYRSKLKQHFFLLFGLFFALFQK